MAELDMTSILRPLTTDMSKCPIVVQLEYYVDLYINTKNTKHHDNEKFKRSLAHAHG